MKIKILKKALRVNYSKRKIIYLFITSIFFLYSSKTIAQGATCATASLITINGACASGTISDTTQDLPNIGTCAGTFNREGWYTFTVAGGPLNVTITGIGNNRNIFLQLISSTSSCTGLSQINCANATTTNGTQTETINATLNNGIYYIKVVNVGSNGNLTLTSLCVTASTPPTNNLCVNATSLPCATNNLAGTTVGTNSIVNGTACSMSDNGVWYTFVGDGQQTTISSTGTGGFDHEMSISSGSCGVFTNIACRDLGLSNGTESYTFTTTNAVIYYVYIAYYGGSNTTGTFTISRTCAPAPVPPINDDCLNAITLTVASACTYTTYTNANATASSSVPAPGCAFYSGGDVWFKAVVPFTGILTVDTQTGVLIDGGMAFYTGTCGSLTLLSCDDDLSNNGAMPYLSQSGLTPGQTIYIRVWEYGNDNNGTFGICATSPTCVAPTINPTINITSTTATISWIAPTSIPSNGYQYIVSTSSTTPIVAGTPTVATSVNLTGLISNTTYYVFVRSDCGSGDFSAWTVYDVFTTGYCPSTSTSSTYYINNFSTTGGTLNITNNGSGYSASGYGNFTAQSVSQINFGSVSFSAVFFDGFYTYGFNIWIDWNDDLDFNDTGELVYASGAYVAAATGTFVVPGTASVGNHRMRIRANYLSTNPSACGSISSGETEDYTFTVLPPLPCSGNPTAINVNVTSQTTSTVNWTAAVPVPANGYQYYLSTVNTTPSALTIPTGSTAAGITTVNLTGLTPLTTYYIWIRSNCGGVLGQGVWVGPLSFYQPNCALGNGSGTTALACPSVIAGGLSLNGGLPPVLNYCASSGCTDLEANYLYLGDTTNYTVQSIPYAPPYQFNCLRNPVSVNIDDVWSPVVNLPFNFCFYGNSYNNCVIGSNGILNFNTTNASGYAGYSFANSLPSTTGALFANSIYGVYHDIDPSKGGEVGWELITLNTGCRALVASWYNVPMFSDNTILYTGMMVLYENTNVIEIYVKEKHIDNNNVFPWNGGNAIVGLQNATATQAVVAPGRNGLDTNWNATDEAWRFTPSGPSISTITWYEGSGVFGPEVGYTDVINVCPTATTIYTAKVAYSLCNGTKVIKTAETTVTVAPDKTWNGSVDTDWNKPNNWTPIGIPDATDCVVIPNTTNKPIVSGTGYNALSGTLTVLNGAVLTINSDNNLTGTNWVNVKPTGTFRIENNASLIQINNVTNFGNIIYKRNATIRKLDYVYWSSPVLGFNVDNISSPIAPGPIYKWNTTVANTNGGQGNWEAANGNSMSPAKGYIVRGPYSFSSFVPSTLNGIFTGVPNNGNITIPISRGSDQNIAYHQGINGTEITNFSDNMNLIGNPYPSAIRASQFLFNNNTKIEGNVRIWTHGTLPALIGSPFYGSFIYNYTPNDYLTFNFTGSSCCPAAGSDLFIGAGQGFFVQMKDGPATTDFVSFNNNLRNFSYANNFFFRTTNEYTSVNSIVDIERHRIWLDIINASNQSNRTLVGYVEGATMERDSFFDANTQLAGAMTIYSLIGTEKFCVQGRTLPFDIYDEVPIGILTPAIGTYSIGIGAIDGLFDTQNIYLKDELLNTINDIKTTPYQFTSTVGTFNNRFKIIYTTNPLSNPNFGLVNDVKVVTNDNITVFSTNEPIESIKVFDILGRKLANYNTINSKEFTLTNLAKNNTTLLIQITLQNGIVVNNKVVY